MLGSPVVAALLWVVALAATVWVLGPAIAFALRLGGLRTVVLPDEGPPPMRADDSVFGPRRAELATLGFRDAGRTREYARFASPMQWRWRSFQPAQWLIGPDGRTYLSLHRLIANEPARMSVVTTFDDGGIVRTACPGPLPTEGLPPNCRMLAVRGVDAAGLLAKHAERVEAYERDRGTTARAATIADITTTESAIVWAWVHGARPGAYSLPLMFLATISMLMVPLALLRGTARSSMAALAICGLAAVYALTRWVVLGPLRHYNARRSHSENIVGDPEDIAEDGTIRATGENEARLRVLASAGAVLSCTWPLALLARLPGVGQRGGGAAILPLLALIIVGGMFTVRFVGRARGRMLLMKRGERNPANLWISMLVLNGFVLWTWLDWSKGPLHRALCVLAGLSMITAFAGWRLEKKRGK